MTYRVVGSHGIRVASGEFPPGSTGVTLTDDEVIRLLAVGAVEQEKETAPAKSPKPNSSAGAAADDEER